MYQAQQNAIQQNAMYKLQRPIILPIPQNTSHMPRQLFAPYAFRPQGLLRSQEVTPQMYPTVNLRPPALLPQNRSLMRCRRAEVVAGVVVGVAGEQEIREPWQLPTRLVTLMEMDVLGKGGSRGGQGKLEEEGLRA